MLRSTLNNLPDSPDRVLVVATPERALDLLRLAVLRSDDVTFVAAIIPPEAERFAIHFAVEVLRRPFEVGDLGGIAAVLVSFEDPEEENRVVREARRHGVPVHVAGRPLVSDFSVLAMLEQPDLRSIAA